MATLLPSLPVSPLGTFLAGPLDPMDRHGRGLARDIGVLRTMLLHCQLKLCGFVQQDGKWQAGAAFGGTFLDFGICWFALYKVQHQIITRSYKIIISSCELMRFRTSRSNHFYRQRDVTVGEGAQAGQRIEVLVSEWWQSVHTEETGEMLSSVNSRKKMARGCIGDL